MARIGDTRLPADYVPQFGSVDYWLKATDRAIRVVLDLYEQQRENADACGQVWDGPDVDTMAADVVTAREVLFPNLVAPGERIPVSDT